jgi:hypothetical protein
MSDAVLRLPARPSLEQLRKQAKERLETLRVAEPAATLAEAQYALARAYGFESWPTLVHHVEAVQSSGRLELFERLARDILAGYQGNAEALQRLIAHFGVSYNPAQLHERVQSMLQDSRSGAPGDPTLAEVQLMLAHQYGFESWAALAEGLAQPPAESVDARLGLSAGPPFYRIDRQRRTIEPHPPLSERDWDTVFAVMQEQQLTGISSPVLTDSALARLARLDFVTRINLDGARQLSDDGVLQFSRMPQLEELDLSGWHSPLTDRGLEVLRELRNLRRFKMCWPQRVSDAGVANLTFCDELELVNLMGTPTGDGAINALRGKRKLCHFNTGKRVTDAGIPLLHDLPVFKRWQGGELKYGLMSFEGEPTSLLLDGPFSDRGLAALAGLDGLFSLHFFWHAQAFTSEGLGGLAELANLGFLGCEGERCDDAAMRRIAGIPKLRMLMAQGTVASDAGFVALSASRTLEHLWGRECPNLTGRGFGALATMPALRGLGVSCKRVDDASLASLSTFPALQFLMPMDVSDDGFRHVGRCGKLESLWCMYCRDTGDAATEQLAGLRLKSYYAGKTRITDRSLEILGRMPSLEKLEFWQTAGISDSGLAALAKLPRLREISIGGAPRVTRQGLAMFPVGVRVEYGG